MPVRRLVILGACLVALAAVPTAGASTTFDLRGKWRDSNSYGYTATFVITTMNRATGHYAGRFGTSATMAGTVTGNRINETISQINSTYKSHVTGTISSNGNRITGTFRDSVGHVGTFSRVRLSGPPAAGGKPTAAPAPSVSAAAPGPPNTAALRVTCSADVACAPVSIVLTPSSAGVPTSSLARAVILGRTTVRVRAHRTVRALVRLNAAGRRRLRASAAHTLSVRVTAFAKGRVVRTAVVRIRG